MQILKDVWQFAKGELNEFVPVSVPHSWLIADTNNLYKDEDDIGWYKFIQNNFEPNTVMLI